MSSTPENAAFADRSLWVAEQTELIPRRFLAERGLSPLLAGYTGGGAFLLLLPEPSVADAEAWLVARREEITALTAGALDLHWTWTENLGPWPAIWQRLSGGMRHQRHTPLAHLGAAAFDAAPTPALPGEPPCQGLAARRAASPAPELAAAPLALPPANPESFGRKANGRRAWGLLRCEIDHAAARLDAAASAEDFQFLAVLYKGLVAGELQRIAALPAHAGRVGIVFSGGSDFAIAGAWDALLSVAAEFHRVFTLFAADLPGGKELTDGATLSGALAVANPGESLAALWSRNRAMLESVRASGHNALALFGRILDWPALKDAETLKSRIRKLREVYHCPPEVFAELEDFYGVRGAGDLLASPRARRRERGVERPWRFHSRLRRLAGDRSGSEFERQWRAFLGDLIGRGQVQKQLRPAGKVALDWAQLESGWRGQD